VAKKGLTAAELLVDEQMLGMLESATKRPQAWMKIGDQMQAAVAKFEMNCLGASLRLTVCG
jgi:hypothetical protein